MAHPALDLTNKTAVVIGGTSGIGLTLAKGLAQAGADVIPTGRRAELVRAAAEGIQQLGRRTSVLTCDVTSRASLQELHDAVCKEFGHVDILLNAAGITKREPTLEMSDEDWSNILEVNLTGALRASQIFGRSMVARGYGRIINIGSLSSFVGLYEVAAYGASKSGLASLTKSLAVEWARKGVCVNAIVPGVFRTHMNAALLDGTARGREFLMRTPMGRFGDVEELVGATVFMASDAASFVTGHLLVVDGGILASGVNQ
jgi:NAD(P)-dependent dehydrogenase (short-subunit alcohol dehydrogenase family)